MALGKMIVVRSYSQVMFGDIRTGVSLSGGAGMHLEKERRGVARD